MLFLLFYIKSNIKYCFDRQGAKVIVYLKLLLLSKNFIFYL